MPHLKACSGDEGLLPWSSRHDDREDFSIAPKVRRWPPPPGRQFNQALYH